MKQLNDLFDDARNSAPPVSLEEAEKVLLKGPLLHKKNRRGLRNILLLVTLASVVTLLALLSKPGRKQADTVETAEAEKAAAIAKDPVITKAEIPSEDPVTAIPPLQQPESPFNNSPQRPSNPFIPSRSKGTGFSPPSTGFTPQPTGSIYVKPQTHADSIINGMEENERPQPEQEQEPTQEKDSIPQPVTLDTVNTPATTETKKEASNDHRHPYNFVKTDLAGYFYHYYDTYKQQSQYHFDVAKVRGGRIGFGYERLLSPRIGLEVNGGYGHTYYRYGYSGSSRRSYSEDIYITYKGWVFNMGLRYYLLKGKYPGSGMYLGPYLGYGYLRETILYDRIDNMGVETFNTLTAIKGQSVGYGGMAGYKYIYRKWFAETTLGLIAFGDDNYFNKTLYMQSSLPRYRNLHRFEVSLGYSF